jgi:antitoxin ParD1/3/4
MSKPYALNPGDETFAEELVDRGLYGSVDEVVREGLRLLKEHEQGPRRDLEELRRAWTEGIESGGYKPAEEVFARLLAKYRGMAEERGA